MMAPALLCLIAFIDNENGVRQTPLSPMALVLFGIAMLCKDSMSCLPFCLLLYLWWKRGRIGLSDAQKDRALLSLFPFLARR